MPTVGDAQCSRVHRTCALEFFTFSEYPGYRYPQESSAFEGIYPVQDCIPSWKSGNNLVFLSPVTWKLVDVSGICILTVRSTNNYSMWSSVDDKRTFFAVHRRAEYVETSRVYGVSRYGINLLNSAEMALLYSKHSSSPPLSRSRTPESAG